MTLSSSAQSPRLPRLAEFFGALLVYTICALIFLRPLFDYSEFGSRMQTRDSVLISVITQHTANALLGRVDFWDFGIFYPLDRSLCLSEPMITPAVLFLPLLSYGEWSLAGNLWLTFSWIGQAVAMWIFLRHRGLSMIPALLGGFLAAYTPDRLWHGAGHSHLYFQAGFILSLFFLEKAFVKGASRLWSVAFGLIFLFQVFCGFYLTLLFSIWLMLLGPCSIWWACEGRLENLYSGMKRQGLILLSGMILTGGLLFPLVNVYSDFGKEFPQNSLELVSRGSATTNGYLIPPRDPERVMTTGGIILNTLRGTTSVRGEDTQYVGLISLSLVIVSFVLCLFIYRPKSILSPSGIFILGVVLVLLTGFILSLGPLWGRTRLPFAYLYAWVDQIRFFRAPARFAFLVGWAIALLAAFSLQQVLTMLAQRLGESISTVVGVAVLCFAFLDFLPLRTSIFQIRSGSDDFARFLVDSDREPFASLPTDSNQLMVWLGHSGVPTANGFSGYYPNNRFPQLSFFEKHFPNEKALAIMDQWGVRRVFVQSSFDQDKRVRAAVSEALSAVWESDTGVLYEVGEPGASIQAVKAIADNLSEQDGQLVLIDNGVPTDAAIFSHWGYENTEPGMPWITNEPTSYLFFEFPEGSPSTNHYQTLVITLSIENWYHLNEFGSIYWDSWSEPGLAADRQIEFMTPGNGEMHRIEVPLNESVAWMTTNDIRFLRFDLSNRLWNRLVIEEIRFE